jgi:nucleotide-binding universal stress UspA family protein
MLQRILFPVDFSDLSVSAACHVRTLASRSHSEITLMHVLSRLVYAIGPMEAGGEALSEAWKAQERAGRQKLDDFAARELTSFRVKTLLSQGDPARAIVDEAHAEQIELIAMPTRGYGQFRRFILGSVTAKVLHDADCPIWTGAHLPPDPEGAQLAPRIEQVLCAIDLLPHSAQVLDWAVNFAAAFNARLFVVHAVPGVPSAEEDYHLRDWQDTRAQRAREEMDKLLQSAGVVAEALVVGGDAPSTVCAQAKELGADLIVIGRSSDSGLLGRLRANAYAIIRSAHCPVVSV